MDISNHVQRFSLPANFHAPTLLQYANLVAEPLARAHVLEDLEAVNSSGTIIRQTRGGRWPEGQLTHDFNFLDLAWHEREFRDRKSFAYAVRDSSKRGEYVGCFYLNPLGSRTPLSEKIIALYDVDVSWWVTTDGFEGGVYEMLFKGIRKWLGEHFPFENPLFSNTVVPEAEAHIGGSLEINDV
jgi:hypothetical protein